MNIAMRTCIIKLVSIGCCLPLLATAPSAIAQGPLIGPFARNGDFEDGVLSPWAGSFGAFGVAEDPSFASHGNWFAVAESAFALSLFATQNLAPNPEHGLVFVLSFDARVGEPGYTSVSTRMDGRTPQGTSLTASISPIMVPPLSSSAWQTYQYRLEMSEAWDMAGVIFAITFSKAEPLGGITHFAYLDNVVLQQIPEPGVLALLALGGALLVGARVHTPTRVRRNREP
jgi:hypothetical protein